MKPPTRIRDDRALPSELAADLNTFKRGTEGYDSARGWSALEDAIARSSVQAPAVNFAHAVRLKLAAAGTVVVFAIGTWFASNSAQLAPSAQHSPPKPQPLQRAAPIPATVPSLVPQPELLEPAVEKQPAPARPSAAESGTSTQREIAQLARVRALLTRAPRAAYRLAEAGHREFGAGLLYHEREALAILALSALPERDQARARAQRFLARYPRSPLRARVEAVQHGGANEP